MLAEGVCEAILDWVVLGHPCPGGVTGSSSEALWALPTYQWHWPWHMALQHTCCQFNGLKPYPSAEERSRVRIASAMFYTQLRKTECTFHVYHVGPFTDARHSAPKLWGHRCGKSISWQNNELLLQISLCWNQNWHVHQFVQSFRSHINDTKSMQTGSFSSSSVPW